MSNHEVTNYDQQTINPDAIDQKTNPEKELPIEASRRIGETILRLPNATEQEKSERIDVNEALEKMQPEEAKEMLRAINAAFRPSESAQEETPAEKYQERNCIAGDFSSNGRKKYIAPSQKQQEKLFGEYFDAIKSIKDRDKRALLAYYAVDNLFLFPKDNENTARAVYLLIKNGNLDDLDDLMATDASNDPHNVLFFSKYNIKSAEYINEKANDFLKKELLEKGWLDRIFAQKHVNIASSATKNGLVWPMMYEHDEQGLSKGDYRELQYALSDSTGGSEESSSLAGLTIASVLSEMGAAERVVKSPSVTNCKIEVNYLRDIHGKFSYEDEDDDRKTNPKTQLEKVFRGWKTPQSRLVKERYKKLKEEQNLIIIDFFLKDTISYGKQSTDSAYIVDRAMGRK